jgi:hypothetical protein
VHLVKRFIHVVQRRVLPHDEQAAQHLAQLNQSMAEVAPAAAWALSICYHRSCLIRARVLHAGSELVVIWRVKRGCRRENTAA